MQEPRFFFFFLQVLSPTQSIEKLICIVKDNAFENGAVIDYYDYE